ncbi:MAG: hypothetical protein UX09_C0009G0005 [Candidatus Uhrbacteria bacterium GW2011_GWE2_45_35]|uniref:Uncharacterized protein n=1 Tax=Candidatus Uhrbacteria bacterium GW2011_GWE2_45_35 TaxID=1618993 RepID=A0A0G1PTU6_9BACT|nr:MAG: hypothetical protein UX09_C0009G0005 [Candidatus Uhrbacteria bacterium GW2011_GWE2_45_35]
METIKREITPEYSILVSIIKKLADNKELLRRMDTVPRYERYFTGGVKRFGTWTNADTL